MQYGNNWPSGIDSIIKTELKVIKSVDLDTSAYLLLNSSYFGLINSLHTRIANITFIKFVEESKKASPPDKFRESYNSSANSQQLTEEEKSKAHFRYFIETANLLISNNQIKEGVIAHKYTMTLENRNIDLGLDSTLVHISNPDIRASLINEYNSYQWRKFHQNSLRVNIEEDSLLNYLKNKYNGYVQYICIWSTWTGILLKIFLK